MRAAGSDDLDAIVALTRRNRHRLGEWEPTFWRVAAAADELHPLWLGHLLATGDAPSRVATRDGEVVACAFSVRQPDQWFVDDVAAATDGDWADAGVALYDAVAERPALTCVPHADRPRAAAAAAAGWEHVSDYRLLVVDGGDVAPEPVGPGPERTGAYPAAPPHTFGRFDPTAPGALRVGGDAGDAVGSPPVAAPPVYDPGGTTCIVHMLDGPDLPALLDQVVAAAARLGARGLVVVCGAGDDRLRAALDGRGFRHPVEVFRAP